MSPSLQILRDVFGSKSGSSFQYWIPRCWNTARKTTVLSEEAAQVLVDPYTFFKNQFDHLINLEKKQIVQDPKKKKKPSSPGSKNLPGDWIIGSTLYGLFVRTFSAYDHNHDGVIGGLIRDITLNNQLVRETGTFLKTAAILPYIASLGFSTIVIEPVSLMAQPESKGELPGPYEVKNPLVLDPIYHDPLAEAIDAEIEFKALVDAAHILGLRVIMSFNPGLHSIESDWVKNNPSWFDQTRKAGACVSLRPESLENNYVRDYLESIIPYYQVTFNIDGALVHDSGILPAFVHKGIIQKARNSAEDFALILSAEGRKTGSRQLGYNLDMGNLTPLLPHYNRSNSKGDSLLKHELKGLAESDYPRASAVETFDSPRACGRHGETKYSSAAWLLAVTLPNTAPYCVAGFEMGDTSPNGLGSEFSPEDIKVLSAKKLGFYNRISLPWNSPLGEELSAVIKEFNQFRKENIGILTHLDNFVWLETDVNGKGPLSAENPVVAYMRVFQEEIVNILTAGIYGELLYPIEVESDYLIVVNLDFDEEVIVTLRMDREQKFKNLLKPQEYKTVEREINLRLKPGEWVIAVSQ